MLLSKCLLSNDRLSYSLLSRSTLAHSLLGGPIYSTTYDRTTPVTVVGAAYDTSGNGGRKLVRLSNGNFIAVVRNGTTDFRLYKSTDNGASWSSIVTVTETVNDVAITTDGTYIYVLNCTGTSGTTVKCRKYDNAGNLQGSPVNVDSSQSALGNCSIIADSSGHLHAAWASKNATYPNSFNIRYSKSTDGGATWASVTQISSWNATGYDNTNPCIVIKDNKPIIVNQMANSNQIYAWYYTTTWSSYVQIYNGSSYAQSNPSAVVDGNGHIHVAWHGSDSTDSAVDNVRYSKSTDGGAAWSAVLKLTSGNTYGQVYPTITRDKNNNLYVLWHGRDAAISTNYAQIRSKKYLSGAWGNITSISNNTANHALYPSSLDSPAVDLIEPLVIYQDNQTPSVKFYGKWTA